MFDPTPRIFKILDAVSQLGNVAWPFWDHTQTTANESISGRAHRESRPLERWINALFFWQPDHCRKAFMADRQRAITAAGETRKTLARNDLPGIDK